MSNADLRCPLTGAKSDRSGGFPRRRVRIRCLPNRSKSSRATPPEMPSRKVLAQVRYRVKPICFHSSLRTRSEIHARRRRSRNSGNLQDVMLAANVDTNNECKLNQYQPPALAPGLATFATAFDFHLRTSLFNALRTSQLAASSTAQSA